jgi:signal transduction histidine kinase
MLMREVSTTVEPMLRSKGLDYDLQISNELPVLETDATKLRQIMLNLLSNAVKFTREGTVSLSARPAPGNTGVEIAIADTGIGIAEEDLPKIFDDFRQVDQSSTREYGGTGLGLSITKKLLTLLGGTIRVDSQRGTGSTFYVWLPSQSPVTPPEDVAEQLASASGVVLSETGGTAPASAPERVDTGADLL